jgi:hypothetical protein
MGIKLGHLAWLYNLIKHNDDKKFVDSLQGAQKNLPRSCTNHLDPTSVIIDISYSKNLEIKLKFHLNEFIIMS